MNIDSIEGNTSIIKEVQNISLSAQKVQILFMFMSTQLQLEKYVLVFQLEGYVLAKSAWVAVLSTWVRGC